MQANRRRLPARRHRRPRQPDPTPARRRCGRSPHRDPVNPRRRRRRTRPLGRSPKPRPPPQPDLRQPPRRRRPPGRRQARHRCPRHRPDRASNRDRHSRDRSKTRRRAPAKPRKASDPCPGEVRTGPQPRAALAVAFANVCDQPAGRILDQVDDALESGGSAIVRIRNFVQVQLRRKVQEQM